MKNTEIVSLLLNAVVVLLLTVSTFFLRRIVAQFDAVVKKVNEHGEALAGIHARQYERDQQSQRDK